MTTTTREEMQARRAHSAALANPRREAVMNELRAALWAHGDMPLLANRTGISVSCLNNLKTGKTRWPRDVTMFTIAPILGLELRLVRVNT